MALDGQDDRDEMGVYIETPEQVLALAPAAGHWIARTQPEGARSGAGDVDLALYSLAKYLRLALAGNPTVLILLYAEGDAVVRTTELGTALQRLAPAIVSHGAGARFLGYLDGQRDRMDGLGRQSRVPNRPELVERHGYDTKYASHALRLGHQGVQLLTEGRLTLPLQPGALSECLAVKRGEVGAAAARQLIDGVRRRLAEVVAGPPTVLRPEPDRARVDAWMVAAQLGHWGLTRPETPSGP